MELPRAARVECPACHADDVHKVAKIDPSFGEPPPMKPTVAAELWACRNCGSSFVKGSA
jgi:ribosomal protein L37AE/L43A